MFFQSERNPTWAELHYRYFQKTRQRHTHAVVLNGETRTELFSRSTIIDVTTPNGYGSNDHVEKLNSIISYFKQNRHGHYLIVDSDCFPIMQDWDFELYKLTKSCGVEAAAITRAENFSLAPHPSAFYFSDAVLDRVNFQVTEIATLCGQKRYDVTCPGLMFYPLMRTNRHNRHPMFAGVYADMFYHHGAGSRRKEVEGRITFHAEQLYKQPHADFFDELKADPDAFIKSLID